jgi:hypothetical protein
MHDCQAKARRDREDDLCYELINVNFKDPVIRLWARREKAKNPGFSSIKARIPTIMDETKIRIWSII